MFFAHLALRIVDQHPAVLNIGHGLARGEDRVGRVKPPHLAIHFGTHDGVVRRLGAGDQQGIDHVATADPRGLSLDAAGLEHGCQQGRQVLAIAVAVLLDFRQAERHITTLAGAPVAQVAVVIIDVLHQRGHLLSRRQAACGGHRGGGLRRQGGAEDLVVTLGEITEVRLAVHGAAHFQAWDAQ